MILPVQQDFEVQKKRRVSIGGSGFNAVRALLRPTGCCFDGVGHSNASLARAGRVCSRDLRVARFRKSN